MTANQLISMVCDSRERTLELHADLTDEEMLGPKLRIVNPPLWELGHVAWFQERWVLRHACGLPPIIEHVDSLYDSMKIEHDTRWNLPLLSRPETIHYLQSVRDRVVDQLKTRELTRELTYFVLLATFHEDMHDEAFTYTRQTHAYPLPSTLGDGSGTNGGPLLGDVQITGGAFMMGSRPDELFVFDNEKWAHPLEVKPFQIARAPVTQSEYLGFVEDGGYRRREIWSEAGWNWRKEAGAEHPVYWRRASQGWERRVFERSVELEPHKPVIHVNWYEADAYARWAGRRLPSEAEWEMAASWDTDRGSRRRYPWGDEPPTSERANLDWLARDTVDVGALPAGDTPAGCRQMIGNVWEWTSDDFAPYPGFSADPYEDYSEPWFHTHKVLRGGCWATRNHFINNTYRNFYKPDRRDVWAGFRTCAL